MRMIQAAKASGIPKDSLERFLLAGYVPQPKQMEFHAIARAADHIDELEDIGYGGARGGGKTHCGFAQIAIDDCQKFNGLSVLFLREKSGSALESISKLSTKVLPRVPHRPTQTVISFPNSSSIKVGHFQYEKDINQYLSLEYDVIFIEQAEQLSQSKLADIKTVNRTSIEGFKPRMYYTFNWGGLSHAFLKKKFLEPYRAGAETSTRFIPATVYDNRRVDRFYLAKLQALTGWKRKAWLDGDPDIFAGQYFEEFRHDKHVIEPRDLFDFAAAGCEFWIAIDYGYRHWTVCYLFTEFDGIIYCLDEFAARNQLISSNCEGIKEMLARWGLEVEDLINAVAGPDVFATKGDSGESFADNFAEHGIYLRAANASRRPGWGKIVDLLGDEKQGIEPSLKISSKCTGLIERLPALMHDPKNPEDVLKVNCDENGEGGDDHPDAFRYGVMNSNNLGVTI